MEINIKACVCTNPKGKSVEHYEDKEKSKVLEDETEASRYCDLLQGEGQGCEGVAEIEASPVFDLCRKMRTPAALFRRGRTLPLPSLELNLKARKLSLEDQDGS
ncbi:Plant/protein [Quillaja saponaria]|uniref:Plant/protein n=1 Tax=Quillaja saponaria TaxID=32244 RepID=A0AAD7L9R6_QUISA|nr:Plant/protein [Quillaja saponaria]